MAKRAPTRRNAPSGDPDWTDSWLERVVAGASTMSQRTLDSIELRGGGLTALRRRARQRGVHLLLLEDEHGRQLVAASLRPFRVIC